MQISNVASPVSTCADQP